jgi:SET domain-containing protein
MFRIGKSSIDGTGLFATASIGARKKLGECTGERISLREARRRAKGLKKIAIVEMDQGAIDESGQGGGVFRYINHSCSPNAYIRIAYNRVEFYSRRAIKPGEELTCDYGATQHNGKLPCLCKSPHCRKFL